MPAPQDPADRPAPPPPCREEVRRLALDALAAMPDTRRGQLLALAAGLRPLGEAARRERLGTLVADAARRATGTGADEALSLAIGMAEAMLVSRELEWLDLVEGPRPGDRG